MLCELVVTNLVIVERAALSLGEGLSVITGETGAGKSLLLDAIDLVTGARARPGLVGRWGDAATVTAVFRLSASQVQVVAEVLGYEVSEAELILRRRVSAEGRSQAWINDVPVTLGALRAVADRLVDLHAQHEPIRLADPAVQMTLLDAFGGHQALAASYAAAHREFLECVSQIESLRGGVSDSLKEADYLRFQLREIEALQPVAGELPRLEARHAALLSRGQERDLAAQAVAVLRDADGCVVAQIQRLVRRLGQVHDERMRAAAGQLAQIAESLREIAADCASVVEAGDADPEEIAGLGARLDQWHALLRKHGPSEDELLTAWRRLTERTAELEGLGDRIAELEGRASRLRRERMSLAERLAASRREAFIRLSAEIHRHLVDLGMPRAVISLAEVPVAEGEVVKQYFLIRTNPGLSPGTIREVASGGEAARLMLAISAALMAADDIPVIIFDEVDSGVGGRLGGVIGGKLAELAQGRSIIAVTHTPQLSAYGASHHQVVKLQGEEETVVHVERLEGERRIAEIAEMLGGGPGAVQQSRAMLKAAVAGVTREGVRA
jgi:DNA repair protein RecN (Recombination protein N)